MKKTHKHTNRATWLKRFQRAFHTKNIVIVSEHAVGHYALSLRVQLAVMLSVLGVVGIASYSIGRYREATQEIVEKERTIEITEAENHKIHNDITLLKRDLVKMSEDGTDLSGYAQFVLDQYETPNALPDIAAQGAQDNKLLERITYLEQELEREQLRRTEFINSIFLLTRDKVRSLQKALEMTGLEDKLSLQLDKKVQSIIAVTENVENETAQGGIYQPLEEGLGESLNEQLVINEAIYLAELTNMLEALPTRSPVMRGRRTSGFGRRIDPFRRTWANHTGIDFCAPIGSKVYATADGQVVRAGYYKAYGNTVDVQHGNGLVTRYAHLSRLHVRVGAKIKAGDVVGAQGSTGRSTGHHLHYEVRYKNIPLNPDKFLQAGHYVSEVIN